MRVRLYKYDGLSDAANKLQTASLVWDSNNADFELYGTFSPYAATFTLSTCYDVNLARYDYNGRDYFGSVSVATLSDGLYTYTVNLDPLTTAWYNGCMNTNALIIRKNESSVIHDIEIPKAPYGKELHIECTQPFNPNNYRLVMLYNTGDKVDFVNKYMQDHFPSQTPGPNMCAIFNFTSTRSSQETFINFLSDLQAQLATARGSANCLNAIRALYCVPNNYLPSTLLSGGNIRLQVPTGNLFEEFTGWNDIDVPTSGNWGFDYYSFYANPTAELFSFDISSIINDSETRGVLWKIALPFIGIITIDPNTLLPNSKRIIAAVCINFQGGFYTVRLRNVYTENNVDKTINLDTVYTFPITETSIFPKPDDGLSSATSVVSGVIGAAASVMVDNYIGAIGSLASGASGAITSGGSYAGVSNGHPDRNFAVGYNKPTIYIHYNPYNVAQTDYAAVYGYPTNTVGKISTAPAGYVQTSNARILRNGLPDDVVKSAEAFCDAGFRVLATP